jgi:hypothetical protein
MSRFQTRTLSFVRLYNGVVYAMSAAIYTAILATLEWVFPGQHVFVPSAPQRDPFMNIAICSWAVLGAGALILLALYYPSKPRDKKLSSSYPEVTLVVLLMLAFAFALIAAGLAASVGAAVLVFIGSRDRYRVLEGETNSLRAWGIPLLTGALPAVLFVLMLLGVLRSLFYSFKALGDGGEPRPRGADVPRREPAFGSPLAPEQEEKVAQLVRMGYTNRSANVAALQASSFDVHAAEVRLAAVQAEVL